MLDLFDQTRTRTMKAISLWQPWATLCARGAKLHETRHWPTAHRGEIALHAAKTLDVAGAPEALCQALMGLSWAEECPAGAIVAVAQLSACLPADLVAGGITRADLAAGNFTRGRFAWRLDRVRPLDLPIPCVGRQGLFNWMPPDDLEDRLLPIVHHSGVCAAIGWV